MKANKIFMAFGKTGQSVEGNSFKRYIGYAPVFVVGINPNKAEWEALYGYERQDAPVYLGTNDVNGQEYPQLRVDIIIKTNEEKTGIALTDRISYFLTKAPNYSKDGTKIQMTDIYGEFQYIDVENAKAGIVPAEAQRFDARGMRPAYIGEEALTNFLRAYLNVPERTVWNKEQQKWVPIKNIDDAICGLDMIDSYFTAGNVQELKDAIALEPNNEVKVLFGIKKVDDKIYSDIYSRLIMRNSASDATYAYLDKEVAKTKAAGGYPNTTFEVVPLKEYNPEATNFTQTGAAAAAPAAGAFFGMPKV